MSPTEETTRNEQSRKQPSQPPPTISEALRESLQIAYNNRWVSDFLFSDICETSFHKSLSISPEVFKDASTTISNHQYISVYPSSTISAKLLCPELIKDVPENHVDYSLLHTIFIPISCMNDIAIGYAFGEHGTDRVCCMPHNPLIPPFIARFAFHISSQYLLYVNQGASPPAIGIRSFITKQNQRHGSSFIVPLAPYNWPYLPTNASWMLSHTEQLEESNIVQTVTNDIDNYPWFLSEQGILSDGLSPAFFSNQQNDDHNNNISTVSTTFGVKNRQSVIKALGALLCGSTKGPKFCMDTLDPFTGRQDSIETGQFQFINQPSGPDVIKSLKFKFIHEYFKCFLAPTTGHPLIYHHGKEEKEEEEEEEVHRQQENGKNDEVLRTFLIDTQNDNKNMTGGDDVDQHLIGMNVVAVDDIDQFFSEPEVTDSNVNRNNVTDFGFIDNILQSASYGLVQRDKNNNNDTTISNSYISLQNSSSIQPNKTSISDANISTEAQIDDKTINDNIEKQTNNNRLPGIIQQQQPLQASPILPSSLKPSSNKSMSSLTTREQILADRKRRNRLSAARSNDRKRLWLEQLENDVKSRRQHIQQLQLKLNETKLENQSLKESLQNDTITP